MAEGEPKRERLEAFKVRFQAVLDRSKLQDARNIRNLNTITPEFVELYERLDVLLHRLLETQEKNEVLTIAQTLKELKQEKESKQAELRWDPVKNRDRNEADMDTNLSSAYSFLGNKLSAIMMSIDLSKNEDGLVDIVRTDAQQIIEELK